MSAAAASLAMPGAQTRKLRPAVLLRLAGAAIFAVVLTLAITGLESRAINGKSYHYTVMMKAGADAGVVSAELSKSAGLKVEKVVNMDATSAFVTSMPSSKALSIEGDPRVAYVEMDGSITEHHSWWDTTISRLGLDRCHL